METVSRNTCFLKTQGADLGLDNFDLRCKSLRLAGTASTLVFFLRFMINKKRLYG